MKSDYKVITIPSPEAYEWIMKKHYAHRMPSVTYAFGLFQLGTMRGVCTFGSPASASLRVGIAGESMAGYIMELNRLCVDSDEPNITSWFVSRCLKMVGDKIIVSYADTAQGHIGKIYQACNFIYTGLSAKRTDWKVKGKEHLHGQTIADESRGHENRAEYMRGKYGADFYLNDRPRKHRYIYVAGNKRFRKLAIKKLRYEKKDYPGGKTSRYDASYKPISQGVLL